MQLTTLRRCHEGMEMLIDRLFRDGENVKLQEASSSVDLMEGRRPIANDA